MSNQPPPKPSTSRHAPSDAVQTQAKTRRSPIKDSAQLVQAIQQAVDQTDANAAYQEALALLEAGCERISSSAHIDQLAELLDRWSESARLTCELGIYLRLRNNAHESVARSVHRSLKVKLEQKMAYPPRLSGSASPEQLSEHMEQLRIWLDNVTQPSYLRQGASNRQTLEPLEYSILACLVGEPRVPIDLIYLLVDKVAEPARLPASPDSSLTPENAALFRQLQHDLFGSTGIRKRLRARLDWVTPARSLVAARTTELNSVQEQRQRLAQTYTHQVERYQACEAAAEQAQRRNSELEKELAETRAVAAHGEERLREREDHWRITAANERARLKSALQERLDHELGEALSALGDSAPNVDMAVRQLKRARDVVREIVSKLER